METDKNKITTVAAYIRSAPETVRPMLELLRDTIKQIVPEAQETIKYHMPTFTLKGNLVHFAYFKNHLGFYPTPAPIQAFRQELSRYHTSKGAIQFPLDQPLPLPLIRQIVRYRVQTQLSHST